MNKLRYWFYYRFVPKHKYHLIDTGLKPAYYDIDTLMLHGMFALLVRYVDREHEGLEKLEAWGHKLCSVTDEYANSCHEQGQKELEACELYRWWTIERPQRPEPFDAVGEPEGDPEWERKFGERAFSDRQYHKVHEIEEAYQQEDQDMLHRLINIRRGLWT